MFTIRTASRPAIPRRLSLGRMVNQSTMLLMVCIGALILLLALLILFHENANATKGYSLRTLENQRNVLLLQEEVLTAEIAQSQALEHLQQDDQVQAMVPFAHPQYVKESDSVALR